ncbi:gem-associated protein 2 isoform X5 [Camelus bactrianus]|uniref:Gem-associated protein 2 isoform X5 n=1 Tax=Camelus bactrianus TaxID=9837 RepID=A0AC58QHF3_CAMBA
MAWVPAESAVEELMPRLLPVEPCDLTEGFDPSVPPRTPQEYLRRVQIEAAQCPDVVVAQIDPKKLKRKQSVNVSGRWLYALLACLEKPLLPEAHSLIRQLARRCSEVRLLVDSKDDERVPALNLLICLVSRKIIPLCVPTKVSMRCLSPVQHWAFSVDLKISILIIKKIQIIFICFCFICKGKICFILLQFLKNCLCLMFIFNWGIFLCSMHLISFLTLKFI